jgi:hypothetical protein
MSSLLTDADIEKIRAKYPSFMKAKKIKVKAPRVKKKKKLRETQKCWHWCPVKKHDWFHVIKDPTGALDEWEQPCLDCKKNINSIGSEEPTSEVASSHTR